MKVLEIFFRNLFVLITQNRVVNDCDQDQHGALLAPIYYLLGAVHEDRAVTSHVGEAVIEVSLDVKPEIRVARFRIAVDRLDKPDELVLVRRVLHSRQRPRVPYGLRRRVQVGR